jgi:uncharacterized protein (TIGR02996 family)
MAAIVADPDDDTVRLAAADFLEEHGDPDRAAFVRVQVELARLEAAGQGKSLEADDLRKKERAYLGPLSYDWRFWAAEACPELVRVVSRGTDRDPLQGMTVEGADRLTWRRGFVDEVACSPPEWLRHGDAIRQRQPVRRVRLTAPDPLTREEWYGMIRTLRGLSEVSLGEHTAGFAGWLREWLPGVKVSLDERSA